MTAAGIYPCFFVFSIFREVTSVDHACHREENLLWVGIRTSYLVLFWNQWLLLQYYLSRSTVVTFLALIYRSECVKCSTVDLSRGTVIQRGFTKLWHSFFFNWGNQVALWYVRSSAYLYDWYMLMQFWTSVAIYENTIQLDQISALQSAPNRSASKC